jgi:hypothetical protein
MSVLNLPVLEKQPWDDRLYDIVFDEDEFRADEVIASVDSITSATLGWAYGSSAFTISGKTHDGDRTVQFRGAEGTKLEGYKITTRVLTNQGNYIEADVLLKVIDE